MAESDALTKAPTPAAAEGGVTGKELAAVLLGLLLVSALQLATFRSTSLFSRHFWFDELHTLALVADPDWLHSLRALAGGADFNPPTYFLLLRAFTLPLGGPSEVTLRLFAFLSVLAGLVGLYLLLRRSWSGLVSGVAVLVVWSHPPLPSYAFEARPYGAWFAASVWFAYLLVCTRTSPRLVLKLALALCAVLLCSLHYFGVIALALIAGGEFLFRRAPARARWAGPAACLAGMLTTAACVPLVRVQRATLTVPTWIDPPTLTGILPILRMLLLPEYLPLLVLPVWLTQLYRSRRPSDAGEPEPDLTPQAGLTGLLLMPLVLVAFSYTLQPVLKARYALPAVAGMAAAVAYLLSRSGRGWVVLAGLVFVFLGAVNIGAHARRLREADERTAHLAEELRQHTADGVVVFQVPLDLLVLRRYAPDVAGRCYAVDFEIDEVPDVSKFDVFQRDLIRNDLRWYGEPPMLSLTSLRQRRHFYFVPDTAWDKPWSLRQTFPDYTFRPVTPTLFEMTAK
jgi:hypothetical protein